MELEKVGEYAFLLGVVIAIVAGIVATLFGIGSATAGLITLVLVILGLIIGFLNVKDKEITTFLLAVMALILVGTAQLNTIDQLIPLLGTVLQLIVINVAVFVAPAALVISLKTVYMLARKPELSKLAK